LAGSVSGGSVAGGVASSGSLDSGGFGGASGVEHERVEQLVVAAGELVRPRFADCREAVER